MANLAEAEPDVVGVRIFHDRGTPISSLAFTLTRPQRLESSHRDQALDRQKYFLCPTEPDASLPAAQWPLAGGVAKFGAMQRVRVVGIACLVVVSSSACGESSSPGKREGSMGGGGETSEGNAGNHAGEFGGSSSGTSGAMEQKAT